MGRTPGAKNKNISINKISVAEMQKNINIDNDDIFFSELLAGHSKWKAEVRRLRESGQSHERESEFAEFYKIGLAKFTAIESE